MGITGRYDFKGIQKAVGAAVDALLAGTAWGAWLLASPFRPVIAVLKNLVINYLANQGLIILNVGAIIVDGEVSQARLDEALADGLRRVQMGRDKISKTEGEAIDNAVRKAFDRDADLNVNDSGLPNVPDTSLRDRRNPSL